MAIERYTLTFTPEMSKSPVLCNIGKNHNVSTIIERANISEEAGWAQVAFSGETEEIQRAIASLNMTGVSVAPVGLAFTDLN